MAVNQEIVDKLCIQYKLSEKVVRAIINSQFEFTRNKIVTTENADDFKNFRYPYLGMLAAKKQTLNKIYKKDDGRSTRNDNDDNQTDETSK